MSADDLVSHRAALDYYFPVRRMSSNPRHALTYYSRQPSQGRLPFDAILADLAPADLLCEGSTVTVDGLADGEMTALNCCRGTILGKRRDDGTFAVRVVKRPATSLLLSEAVGAPAEAPAGEAAVDVVLDQTNLLLNVEPSVARHLSISAKYDPLGPAPRRCSPMPLTSAPANAGPSLKRPSPLTRASSAVSPRNGPAWSPPSHVSSACRTCRFGSSLSRCRANLTLSQHTLCHDVKSALPDARAECRGAGRDLDCG